MTFGILPVDFRERVKRYLEDNAFRDDAILGSVDVEGGEFVDPGGVVHTGEIGGSVGDPGNVLGGSAGEDAQVAVHPSATTSGGLAAAVGFDSVAGGSQSIALGATAQATAIDTMAVGSVANASGLNGSAVGVEAEASALTSTALGKGAVASGQYSTALAGGAVADDDSSVAIGHDTTSPGANNGRIGVDQLVFGASAGSIPDSELSNGELTVDADESNSQFQLRYKDSSGNIQTGTISFD